MRSNILEAIQKGIQMGLEIQDDELDQPTFQGSQITSDYHADRANQLRWVRENFVDLGLPSGTLWMKCNIGATCGNKAKSWYGNYYAWGETRTKENFRTDNYKFCGDTNFKFTKYNYSDKKITLDPEDDAVSAIVGGGAKLPSVEDVKELGRLDAEWVENYNRVNGLNGMIFIGRNGNKLFIPAAGCYQVVSKKPNNAGRSAYLLTDSLFGDPIMTNYMFCTMFDIGIYAIGRTCGLSARGVLHV